VATPLTFRCSWSATVRRRVEHYLRSLPERQRLAIEVVSIDPYEAYRQAIRPRERHCS
jgi:hypothetical protein